MLFCSQCNNPIVNNEAPELPKPGVVICIDCSVVNQASKGKKWRIDASHALPGGTTHSSDLSAGETIHQPVPDRQPSNKSLKSIRFAIFFGLAVFLGGQALVYCGFLTSSFQAWSIGTLFTIAGIVVSLLSVIDALRQLETRISYSIDTTARGQDSLDLQSRRKPNRTESLRINRIE